MANPSLPDRLTGQLYHLPAIIAGVALSVADAQKDLNADYMKNIKKLMVLMKRTFGEGTEEDVKQKADAIRSLLESLAPSRYQFTETTIDFAADLAETFDATIAGQLGFGIQAITVNAAFSLGYGYDYRAAARISVNLHARGTDPSTVKDLIRRASELKTEKLPLPQLSVVEKELWDTTTEIYNALTDREVAPVDAASPNPDAQ